MSAILERFSEILKPYQKEQISSSRFSALLPVLDIIFNGEEPSEADMERITKDMILDAKVAMEEWPIDSDESGEMLYLDPESPFEGYIQTIDTFHSLRLLKKTYTPSKGDIFL